MIISADYKHCREEGTYLQGGDFGGQESIDAGKITAEDDCVNFCVQLAGCLAVTWVCCSFDSILRNIFQENSSIICYSSKLEAVSDFHHMAASLNIFTSSTGPFTIRKQWLSCEKQQLVDRKQK
jgi:hypothetical protein